MSFVKVDFPQINTERLSLRQLEDADAIEIFNLRSNDAVNEYLDRPKTQSTEEALQFIHKINKGIEQHEWLYWAITLKADRSVLIGTVCLWNFSANDTAEIGYELQPVHQGKGIMQEAIAAVIDCCFNTIKLRTLKAYTHIQNGPSSKLLEKFNFKIKLNREPQDGSEEELKNMIIYTLSAS